MLVDVYAAVECVCHLLHLVYYNYNASCGYVLIILYIIFLNITIPFDNIAPDFNDFFHMNV